MSYAAVTIAALLAVELIVLAAMSLFINVLINTGAIPARLAETAAGEYAPTLRPYLDRSSPDTEGVATWLNRFESTSITIQVFGMIPVHISEGELEMLVVGSDLNLLGRTPGFVETARVGVPLDPGAIPGAAGPLEAALAGETDPDRLYTLVSSNNKAVMTAPVWNTTDERVLGALVMSMAIPTTLSVLGDMVPVLAGSALLFAMVAGLAGSVFGFLAARGLVNRLNQLAEGTLAWREGDFTVRVDDSAGDELGQLARRLNAMAQQLEDLLETRRELALAEERNRLARELHDTVKQRAFAAGAQIGAARKLLRQEPDLAEERMDEADRLMDDLRQELTGLLQDLHPTAILPDGLVASLRNHASDWSRQNEITLKVDIQGEQSLPPEVEQAVFRIIQEAPANIARHSGASDASVGLIYANSRLCCSIIDDGGGFDSGQEPDGFGLRSMRERANAIGGELAVDSKVGQGTKITLIVPIGNISSGERNPKA